jgi:hypothetical protein
MALFPTSGNWKRIHFPIMMETVLPLDLLDGGALHDDDFAPAEN